MFTITIVQLYRIKSLRACEAGDGAEPAEERRAGDTSSVAAVNPAQPEARRAEGHRRHSTLILESSEGEWRRCFRRLPDFIVAILREETKQVASQCNGRAPITLLDDCELWFDITQNDKDGDGLTWWQEVEEYGTDPTEWDTDGDGMSDREHMFATNLNPNSDDDNDGMSAYFEVNVFGTNPTVTNNKYAILWNTVDDWNDARGMEHTLETYYCYGADSIQLLDGDDATSFALETAINQVANVAGADDIVYIMLSSHGEVGYIGCNNGMGDVTILLDYSTLNEWLNRITCKMLIVTIDACYGGSAIEPLRDGDTPRVIYTSCSASQKASGLQSFTTQFSLALMPSTSAYNDADAIYGDNNGYVSIFEAFLYADENDNDYWQDKPQGEQTAQASVHTWGMSMYLGEAINP